MLQATGMPVYHSPIRFRFDQRKATEASAYLLQLEGGEMEYYRLMKLLYCAERDAFDVLGRSICGDKFVSLKYGPILSSVLNLAKEDEHVERSIWEQWIERSGEYTVRLTHEELEFDVLSEAEKELLRKNFEKLKDMKWKQLRDYTHAFAEYRDPGESALPIEPEDILEALGKTDEQKEQIRKIANEERYFTSLFGNR